MVNDKHGWLFRRKMPRRSSERSPLPPQRWARSAASICLVLSTPMICLISWVPRFLVRHCPILLAHHRIFVRWCSGSPEQREQEQGARNPAVVLYSARSIETTATTVRLGVRHGIECEHRYTATGHRHDQHRPPPPSQPTSPLTPLSENTAITSNSETTVSTAATTVSRPADVSACLLSGVGAQGGNLDEACSAALDARGMGLLVPVSRGISKAADPAAEAVDYRDRINLARVGGCRSVLLLLLY